MFGCHCEDPEPAEGDEAIQVNLLDCFADARNDNRSIQISSTALPFFGREVISPIVQAGYPIRLRESKAPFSSRRTTTRIIPIPMLKTRHISSSGTFPKFGRSRKIFGVRIRLFSREAWSFSLVLKRSPNMLESFIMGKEM